MVLVPANDCAIQQFVTVRLLFTAKAISECDELYLATESDRC